jgi:DNA-binding MarR family transcriptional regulator
MSIQAVEAPSGTAHGAASGERVSGGPAGGNGAAGEQGGVAVGPDAEVDRIVALYRTAGRALRANDPANWASGLTMPQLRVLFYVGRYGPVSVGQVAAGLGIAQPSATEKLDKLVRLGLAERTADPSDRRIVLNALTDAGREMIDRPWETRRALLASGLRAATPADRAAIEKGLALLCAALERAEGEGRA